MLISCPWRCPVIGLLLQIEFIGVSCQTVGGWYLEMIYGSRSGSLNRSAWRNLHVDQNKVTRNRCYDISSFIDFKELHFGGLLMYYVEHTSFPLAVSRKLDHAYCIPYMSYAFPSMATLVCREKQLTGSDRSHSYIVPTLLHEYDSLFHCSHFQMCLRHYITYTMLVHCKSHQNQRIVA